MREIRTSGSMSGDGKRSVAAWPKLPRPSSTLPKRRKPRRRVYVSFWGSSGSAWTDGLGGLRGLCPLAANRQRNWLANYLWHGVIDRRDAPRWNPDWISPDQLYAELAGRALGALQMMPKS